MKTLYQHMSHHPDDATLMSFGAGTLVEPLALVIATHCAICPTCATQVKIMERIGSALMAGLEPQALSKIVPYTALRSVEADVVTPTARAIKHDSAATGDVPQPLRGLIGERLDDIEWRRLGLGVWHAPVLPHKTPRGDVRLLRVAAGCSMPEHGHGGSELTLILRGAYQDEIGRFVVGDVADLADDVEHRPVADATMGCICLIASDKHVVFKSFLARLIQPLTGI